MFRQIKQHSYPFIATAMVIVLAVVLGCGEKSDLEKVIVSGEVTYKGQPVGAGDIRFDPVGETKGPVSGARIVDGKYTADGRGGVPVGEHIVRIRGFHTSSGGGEGDMLSSAGQRSGNPQYIPSNNNSHSDLYVTIESGEAEQTQDFHLK